MSPPILRSPMMFTFVVLLLFAQPSAADVIIPGQASAAQPAADGSFPAWLLDPAGTSLSALAPTDNSEVVYTLSLSNPGNPGSVSVLAFGESQTDPTEGEQIRISAVHLSLTARTWLVNTYGPQLGEGPLGLWGEHSGGPVRRGPHEVASDPSSFGMFVVGFMSVGSYFWLHRRLARGGVEGRRSRYRRIRSFGAL
jgi:hypothetical protein